MKLRGMVEAFANQRILRNECTVLLPSNYGSLGLRHYQSLGRSLRGWGFFWSRLGPP
jgi:hypothetical protein